MAEPSSNSNPRTYGRKKRRKLCSVSTDAAPAERWRSGTEQQIYSLKLIDALRRLRRPNSPGATVLAVRDAADRVLANSARGRTRWSRAMMNRRRISLIRRKHKTAPRLVSGSRNPAVRKKAQSLQRKVRVLSRLVPGCRKLSLTSLIEEATDYIAALEMQVKAMALLNGLLNGAVSGAVLAKGNQ